MNRVRKEICESEARLQCSQPQRPCLAELIVIFVLVVRHSKTVDRLTHVIEGMEMDLEIVFRNFVARIGRRG